MPYSQQIINSGVEDILREAITRLDYLVTRTWHEINSQSPGRDLVIRLQLSQEEVLAFIQAVCQEFAIDWVDTGLPKDLEPETETQNERRRRSNCQSPTLAAYGAEKEGTQFEDMLQQQRLRRNEEIRALVSGMQSLMLRQEEERADDGACAENCDVAMETQ